MIPLIDPDLAPPIQLKAPRRITTTRVLGLTLALGLAFAAQAQRIPRRTGPPPPWYGPVVVNPVRLAPAAAISIDPGMIHAAPVGIDDRMIHAAPAGIDDAMIVDHPRAIPVVVPIPTPP